MRVLSMKGKVAIVTGAGSVGPGWGNGRATATLLARQGASHLPQTMRDGRWQGEDRTGAQGEGEVDARHYKLG